MPDALPIAQVHEVIRLAVAPVFLLTGIGTILAVLSGRLGRIIDRARVLAERLDSEAQLKDHEAAKAELAVLVARRRIVGTAITCGVAAALFVCLLITMAFVASLLGVHVAEVLAVLFITAMVGIVASLVLFLREILLTTFNYRIDVR